MRKKVVEMVLKLENFTQPPVPPLLGRIDLSGLICGTITASGEGSYVG